MASAISIKDLTVSYGKTPALIDVNAEIEEKDFVGIMGPNGGGKSTLLKAILGLIPIESGKIEILGKTGRNGIKNIGYVPQFAGVDRLFPINVKEVVLSAFLKDKCHFLAKYTEEEYKKAEECLNALGILELKDRQISDLSGGEFQRLLIARAIATNPKILLLDEPTASVDPASKATIYSVLEKLNKDITIIMVSHDLFAISSTVKRIICVNRGIIYHGEPKLDQETMDKMYGCPVDIVAHGVAHRVLGSHNHG